jgi:acetyltransferase-like isoleucine patch superfamily enzyme
MCMITSAKIWNKVMRSSAAAVGKRKLRLLGVEYGEGLVFYGVPIVSMVRGSRICIGRRTVLCSRSSDTALGVAHPVVLRTLSAGAELLIGEDVGLSGATICSAERIVIGSETMLGAGVTITDTDFHPLSPDNRRYNRDLSRVRTAEVVVGANVFIGTNSLILKGVSIGENSVIGAGSVVTSDVPENVIAAGNPCRVLRKIVASEEVARFSR